MWPTTEDINDICGNKTPCNQSALIEPLATREDTKMEISNILWCDNCQKSTLHEQRNPDICCTLCDWVTATEHSKIGVTNDNPVRAHD